MWRTLYSSGSPLTCVGTEWRPLRLGRVSLGLGRPPERSPMLQMAVHRGLTLARQLLGCEAPPPPPRLGVAGGQALAARRDLFGDSQPSESTEAGPVQGLTSTLTRVRVQRAGREGGTPVEGCGGAKAMPCALRPPEKLCRRRHLVAGPAGGGRSSFGGKGEDGIPGQQAVHEVECREG